MPSQIQAASSGELAELQEDDRVRGEASKREPEVPRVGKPGDRPLRSPDRSDTTLHRTAVADTPPPLTFRRRPSKPERTASFGFGYRLFMISDALGRAQSWHMGSVEVSPLRRFVRLDFITELGAEGGAAARDGDRADLMFVQKGALGLQYPGYVSPYVAFQGGAGFARVEVFDRNDLVFLYTLGLDVGAQWAVTKWLFLHAAVGWLHPTFRRPEQSVHYDTFTFKLGFGM
jgi:hypothetical protein